MAKEILTADLGGRPLSPEELAAIPDFAVIKKEIWGKFPGAIALKDYEPGEILFKEGDFGTTAFYLLSGEIDVLLQTQVAALRATKREKRSWFRGLTKISNFVRGVPGKEESDGDADASERTHIPMDGSVDLPMNNPIAVLGPGELFGELCALAAFKQEKVKRPKFYPRSATVRARTRVQVLEMLPNILNNVFYNTPAFRERLNDNYRNRALDNHLRSVPVFKNLSQEFLDYLRKRVELVHCSPGQVICRQGDPADAFYLIRLGFVKVSQEFPGGEMVLTYLSRGSYFGEMGLMPPVFRVNAHGALPGQTADALLSRNPVTVGRAPSGDSPLPIAWDDHISRDHFEMHVEGNRVRVNRLPSAKNPLTYRMHPFDSFLMQPGESFVVGNTTFEVNRDLMGAGRRVATCTAIDFVQLVRITAEDFSKMLDENHEVDRAIAEVAHARWDMDRQILNRVQKVSLNDFLGQELMQGQNLLLLDLNKCVRCDECVKACAATHEDGVTRLVRDGLRFDNYLVPTTCRACMDPLCMTRCPVGAIRRKSSLDIIIEDWCIGCGNCATDCPYGNINVVSLDSLMNTVRRAQAEGEVRAKATVCDLCVDYSEPNCVRACPHDAAMRVEPKKFFAQELAGLQLSAVALEETPTAAPVALPAIAGQTKVFANVADLVKMLPHLRVIAGPQPGASLQLRHPSTTFGRGAEVDYPFPDEADLSRLHCSIVAEGGRFVVRDNQSTNGTFVNGNRVTEMELRIGDVIQLGAIQLEMMAGQAPGPTQ